MKITSTLLTIIGGLLTSIPLLTSAADIYKTDAASVSLTGRAEARMQIIDGKVDDQSRIRMNIMGKTMINSSMYAIGDWEGEFQTSQNGGTDISNDDGGGTFNTRYAYAGLGGNFGEVTYGENDGALGILTDFTDIMAYHGNNAAYKISVADRTDNMLTYQGQYDHYILKASYRFADSSVQENKLNPEDNKMIDNDQDGYSVSVTYTLGDTGVMLGAGYADQADENEAMLTASYTLNDWYIATNVVKGDKYLSTLLYPATLDAYDSLGYEFATSYTLGKTVFTATYNNLDMDTDDSGIGSHAGDVSDLAFDVSYYFVPNFRAYASYNFNLLSSGHGVSYVEAEDDIALGMRYDF
ncbi:porin [Vibrio sp. S11_S32]|uniref:porin n=1 Tax=Vibrio sp. S11_S32 TaxID=2720225 RepID=UPI0016814774|nr:porin [Vibrio sp. S11_S32]MBD1576091.1 porin [Vibrio sp. S11_S32]